MITGALLALLLQTAPSPSSAPSKRSTMSQPNDIVVEAQRDPSRPLPTQVKAAPNKTGSAIKSRISYEQSHQLARCAVRGRLADTRRLRAAIDGVIYSADQRFAQGMLVKLAATCGPDTTIISADPLALGTSIYDRGALVTEALQAFAPDLKLTARQTHNPAVAARFNRREIPLNRTRLPVDFRYFEVAVCMVREQPGDAVRLAMRTDPARTGGLQDELINGARICVGNARNVYVDPTQFRMYIADAVYRWAVAARGSNSLIPDK